MEVSYCGQSYRLRSAGLFRFLSLLHGNGLAWVDLAAIDGVLPGIAPRQLARFIDTLDALHLPLVHYETKTRGRYRLAVPAEALVFNAGAVVGEAGDVPRQLGGAEPIAACDGFGLLDENWLVWTIALVHAMLQMSEGRLFNETGAQASVDVAAGACHTLPAWTKSVVDLRRVLILGKQSNLREALHSIRRVNTALRAGRAHPGVGRRARLVHAKMYYDRGLYARAERRLGNISPQPCLDAGALNMRALLNGQRFLAASPAKAFNFLSMVFSDLTEALGEVFLGNADSGMLDCLTFNIGNNILRGVHKGIFPPTAADIALQWFACNRLVCRKFGIGDDSVLVDLLLVDVGAEFGYSITHWPAALADIESLDELLTQALIHARQTGNRMEIGECLLRQVRYAPSAGASDAAFYEAMDIFDSLGMKSMKNALYDAKRSRGTTGAR